MLSMRKEYGRIKGDERENPKKFSYQSVKVKSQTTLANEISIFTKRWGNGWYKRGELHELIGATVRLLLSSIYTRNEGKL